MRLTIAVGHPEEVLASTLGAAAVIAAGYRRPGLAGVTLGLAIGTKQWALLAAPPVLLAALGIKMLQLARERTAGAHPYFVPVEHTLEARGILGDDRVLAPEIAVVFALNREAARGTGDRYMKTYLNLENYRRNLVRLGWPKDELESPGSDRIFDAVVAWGEDHAIASKVRLHHDAGADHVAVQVLTPTPDRAPLDDLRRLAPLLLS